MMAVHLNELSMYEMEILVHVFFNDLCMNYGLSFYLIFNCSNLYGWKCLNMSVKGDLKG